MGSGRALCFPHTNTLSLHTVEAILLRAESDDERTGWNPKLLKEEALTMKQEKKWLLEKERIKDRKKEKKKEEKESQELQHKSFFKASLRSL